MLSSSLDGQWAVLRRGREVSLYKGTSPTRKTLTLPSDDDVLAWVGPPTVLARISHAHAPAPTRIELISVPDFIPVAKLDLDTKVTLVATTGPRLALVGVDALGAATHIIVVRTAGSGLAAQSLDVNGVPVESALGIANDQLLFVMRKDVLALYDAVSSRALGRPQLPLPPPPRVLGTALGHAWATHASTDDVFVYRLSDGRPFRHAAGAVVERAISHPASPVIVLVTPRGLIRLHCQAHSLTLIDSPYVAGTDLALVPGATSEDVSLIGIPPGSDSAWRVAVGKPPVR